MKPASSIGLRRCRSSLRVHTGFPSAIPLLDLFFLLLIFILMAGSMVRLSGIPVNLPRVQSNSLSVSGSLLVTIVPLKENGECQIFFRDVPCELEDLRRRFSLLPDPSGQRVIIRADKEVPSGVLDEVIAVAQEAKLSCFLAVEPPDSAPETNFE